MLGLSKTNMLQCSARLQPFQHVPSPLAARPRSVVARAMDPGMMEQMKKMMSDPAVRSRYGVEWSLEACAAPSARWLPA